MINLIKKIKKKKCLLGFEQRFGGFSTTTGKQFIKILIIWSLVVVQLLSRPIRAQVTQKFEIKPADISVNLGETALLKCSVSARHGDVQWIHDGTALGYDRKVPGKPRYSVIWNENEDTEYHLQIENVTLEDEGLFSCQAAPIGDWDTKLEARARLTVLLSPKNGPEIMFNDESKNSDEIVHFRLSTTKLPKFTCILRKSKPAGVIKWFLNGTLVNVNLLGKITETKQSDGVKEDLTSVFEMKNQLNPSYNNSLIKCQAYHLAYGLSKELQNMSISLRIVVVYPPSVPTINGYDKVGVIAGSELKLVCSSSYTYPPPMLSWYRDGRLVSKNYDTIESMKTTESLYKIGKVSPTDNKALLTCNSINQAIDDPLATNVSLNVLYGPEKLTINGVFEVEAGKQINAVCFSDSANPSPRLRFSFDGLDYEPNTFLSTPTPANVAVGAFIVNGTFTQTVRQEHNNKELKCYAENKAANVQQIVTKLIKVLYPPDSLDIIYSQHNKLVQEGTKIRVICTARGGNPLPDIEWSTNTKSKLPSLSTQAIVYTVESTFDLVLQREHHNQALQCQAINKVGSLKKTVNLNVSYLPSTVNISIIHPKSDAFQLFSNISIRAGTKAIFACRSPDSNPQAQITWTKDSYHMAIESNGQHNTTSTFVNSKEYDTISYLSFEITSSDHMKEIRCDVKVGDIARTMHGSIVLDVKFAPEIIKYPPSVIDINENATFTLNLTARANPAPTYKCTASNNKKYTVANATLTFVTTRTDNSDFVCSLTNSENTTEIAFKLNVKYAPTAKVNNSLYVTTKGNTIQLYCLIDGNPLQSSHITWKLNNKPLINSDIDQHYNIKFIPPNLSVLTIINARDTDDGNFTCHVANTIGSPDVALTELRVKRSPLILTDTSILKAGEDSNIGRSASFICRARAYPNVSFKWKQPNNVDIVNSTKFLITNSKTDSQTFSSVLTINTISSNDYGTYMCEARTEIGSTVAKAILSGKHQPEQPSEFKVTNITRNSITLTWKKNFDGGDPQKFRIRYRKDTIDPIYKYVETENDITTVVLENLETATRYVINIQSFNKFGTEGFLREPLIVQTDFGFNEINQMPIYNGNNLPLTIILVVCGVGTLLLVFNVALIVYLIKRKKKKGEADSTTDTNETEANTVEMFSPPPPYPDELNYHFDLNANTFEDEYKPFVPHLHANNMHSNHHQPQCQSSSKYFKELNDQSDYAIEYATPIHQSWSNHEQNEFLDDDIHITSLRQLDHKLSTALADGSLSQVQTSAGLTSLINTNRHSLLNRPFGTSSSYQQNLNQIPVVGDAYLLETRAFPYERLNQCNNSIEPSNYSNGTTISTQLNNNNIHNNSNNNNYRTNSSCKLYQDLDEFKGHLV